MVGSYDSEWNPGMTDVQAASFTSASIGIAYSAPFIGGIVADGVLGDYWSIMFGVCALYIPGLILIALTTFPELVSWMASSMSHLVSTLWLTHSLSLPSQLGSAFNTNALKAGLLVLMPIGTGFIKPVVNVFGAKQFHP